MGRSGHAEIQKRNHQIKILFLRGITRKMLAYRFQMTYEAVKKVLQQKLSRQN